MCIKLSLVIKVVLVFVFTAIDAVNNVIVNDDRDQKIQRVHFALIITPRVMLTILQIDTSNWIMGLFQ